MNLMANIRRECTDGTVQKATVNPAHVRYVYSKESGGSYIAFEDEHSPNSRGVTPIGISSPDSVEVVTKGLNRPYYIGVWLRFASLFLSAIAIVVAIVSSSGCVN